MRGVPNQKTGGARTQIARGAIEHRFLTAGFERTHSLQRLGQPDATDRLQQVIHCVQFESVHCVLIESGTKNHVRARMGQGSDYVDPATAGHLDVEQNQVGF